MSESIARRVGVMGIANMLLGGYGELLMEDIARRATPAQTNAVQPDEAPPGESRQVRRARERREAKARRHRGY